MKNVWFFDYPIGKIGIAENGDAISDVIFNSEKISGPFNTAKTPLIQKAAAQLTEYFNKERMDFDLPLFLEGTDFQISVWNALQTIPYGETRSYKDIAAMIGNPKACRAVGMANNRNPISIIIPCHRVIGSGGNLVGYGGGLTAKQYLLELERNSI
jgi:methylated-DNA-[protein]-cysteine S-methyltransferase